MAYTDIDDPTIYFNTKLYTGNGSTNAITGVGFAPDWTLLKDRNDTSGTRAYDTVRGAIKRIRTDLTDAEIDDSDGLTAFGNDGFTLGADGATNANSTLYVSWNWSAGGASPAITYTVKVVSDSGNKYRFDDFGTSAVTLDLQEGGTYTFDQSDSSNSGHPLRFYTASDKSGGEYTTGVTTTGTAGNSGAKTVITVAASAPTLYYQCSNHAGMGGQANTNSLFGSSNFSGSVQTKVSANTTAGFSIVSYSGTGTAGTVGHGLGSTPKLIIVKVRNFATNWLVQHANVASTKVLYLDANNAETTDSVFNDTLPTSSVFSVKTANGINASGKTYIAYCFSEIKGYSKFGSYTGNGNADGTYVHLGFRPAWIVVKPIDATQNWQIHDTKRLGYNVTNKNLSFNNTASEAENDFMDILSNGFKIRRSDVLNVSGDEYIYWAFAESPFVNSKGVPTNAR